MLTKSTEDAEAAAVEAARIIEATAAAAVADRGHFNLAISGGRTPWRTLEILAGSRMNWSRTSLFQV
ncbi:MAG: 6-phosphogluconolactonase, partial [Actinomycetota bacterium]|nr:6-phosphogluconolactonase [Actinomycetota bacterium]